MELTLREWLGSTPPTRSTWAQTLSAVAERAIAGEGFRVAVREFLDEFALRPDELRAEAIAERPLPTGVQRHDAFLGALAEHLAAEFRLTRPDWAIEPGRFLDEFWFVSEVPGFRALQIAESPAAFRRRGIFISTGALHRV